MKWRSLENKLFVWVLIVCTTFGLATGWFIVRSEEQKRLAQTREALNLVSVRYANQLTKRFRRHIGVMSAANRSVKEMLTNPTSIDMDIKLYADEGGAVRSTDGFSGAFLSKDSPLTPEARTRFATSQVMWKQIAPVIVEGLFNFYLITKDDFIRIYPKNWALEIEADHSFATDLFYMVADPKHNPDRLPAWTPVYYDSIWGKWMTSLIIPLYDESQFLGITGADVILDDLFSQIEDMDRTEGWCKAFIVDGSDNIVVHPDYMQAIREKQATMNTMLSSADIADKGLASFINDINAQTIAQLTDCEFESQGSQNLASVHTIVPLNWRIVVFVDRDYVDAPMASLRFNIMLISGVLAIALALILRIGLKKVIINRVRRLSEAAQRIGQGDWETELPKASNDEVGVLAESFGGMRDQLRNTVQTLEERVEERTEEIKQQGMIMEQVKDSVIVTDLTGKIINWNDGSTRMFGYAAEEAYGRHITLTCPQDEQGWLQDRMTEYLEENGSDEIDIELVSKFGSLFFAHVALSFARNSAGIPNGMIAYITDVTARIKTEKAMKDAKEQAEEAARSMSEVLKEKERFHQLVMGREQRIIALKQDINQLLKELDREPEYQSYEEKPSA